jgi:hypothetical protein
MNCRQSKKRPDWKGTFPANVRNILIGNRLRCATATANGQGEGGWHGKWARPLGSPAPVAEFIDPVRELRLVLKWVRSQQEGQSTGWVDVAVRYSSSWTALVLTLGTGGPVHWVGRGGG